MQYLLNPRSVAIIGASKRIGSIGYSVLKCALDGHFKGSLYPVNPSSDELLGIKTYPSISSVPGEVDLAVLIVPAKASLQVAQECGRKGVKALVVISDGFKETGPEGASLERELTQIVKSYGMQMVGPNCIGILNPAPEVSLNASFCTVFPPPGALAIITQSGALGLTILEYVMSINVGVSFFVSVGNSADLNVNDFLAFAEKDPKTKAVMLYLESFQNPEEFKALAKRISLTKPIVVIKTGKTLTGSKAASSHTGALASKEMAVNALFQQTGLINVETFHELIGTSLLVSSQPLPKGRRIAVMTQAGGAATISADACERNHLVLPEFSEETLGQIKGVISRPLSLNNPLDLTGGAQPEEYYQVAEILAQDKDNDILLCIWGPVVVFSSEAIQQVLNRLSSLCRKYQKPLLACFMVPDFQERTHVGKESLVPVFQFPEGAIAAIARVCDYTEAVKRLKEGVTPTFTDICQEEARQIIEEAKSQASGASFWLKAEEVFNLLNCYGIRQAKVLTASNPEEAGKLASQIGYPVAVKLLSSTLTHKTEVGGVILGIKSEEEVRKAWKTIYHNLQKHSQEHLMEGVTLQPMIEEGLEVIVGLVQDNLGRLIMLGLGGIYTEVLQDTVFRLSPITDIDAREMISSLKSARLLQGFRDLPPRDIQAVEDLLLRVSALVKDVPEISELDLNPVKVMPQKEGYWVVDARIHIK